MLKERMADSREETDKRYRRYVQELRYIDDSFMSIALNDKITVQEVLNAILDFPVEVTRVESQRTENCALPGFVDSKNEEKTERNAGYLVVSHSGGGMLRQGTRKGIRRTPANRGMRAHWVVKGLDISEDVCHGMCP